MSLATILSPPLQGDLGSPLVAKDEGEGGAGWVQVGVMVSGDGCIKDKDSQHNFGPHSSAVYISVTRE